MRERQENRIAYNITLKTIKDAHMLLIYFYIFMTVEKIIFLPFQFLHFNNMQTL